MRDLSEYFKNKEIDSKRLLDFGFIKEKDYYIYRTKIQNKQFEIIVYISEIKKISKIIDMANDEEYILVDISDSTGEFVGKLRDEYESIINDIIEKCTKTNIFKNNQSKEIIKYIKEKYNDDLEFLWEKFDNNAIWRNKQNYKWYGIILTITKDKLKLESEERIEVLDLRYQKGEVSNIIDNTRIFPGYHMNKDSWITIILDYSVSTKKMEELIDNSYNLSIGNKCGLSGGNLSKKVYEYLTKIPKGKVVTYKQVAEYIGNKGLARVVGNILHKNPDGDKYPCYKVLNSKGELAKAFVFGGEEEQKKKLEKDGIEVYNNKVDLKKYQWIE